MEGELGFLSMEPGVIQDAHPSKKTKMMLIYYWS